MYTVYTQCGLCHHVFLQIVHGSWPGCPGYTRVSECVALKLLKEYREARNRPKDIKGRTFAIPQSIVMTYCHVKQLIEDCKEILQNSNLVLMTINNITVSSWLQDRQKRTDRDSLLQGVELPQQVYVAEESQLAALDLPSEPVPHGHADMEFQEPENREASQSQGWSPYQPPSTTVSHSQGWSPYQPPSTTVSYSQGWSPYQPPSTTVSHSQGWSPYQPPSTPASHIGPHTNHRQLQRLTLRAGPHTNHRHHHHLQPLTLRAGDERLAPKEATKEGKLPLPV
ncbi:hypothetical protein JOB18_027313 [Solea senegalensis]|uniref:Uncharacterized protein n=1 Tax=Solea senegalensis TaxID=28829 RepID=A0AAV6S218_SOLSE|nr:hypothetical protein JOB18_027313 [Solea senegalensis]